MPPPDRRPYGFDDDGGTRVRSHPHDLTAGDAAARSPSGTFS